MSAATPRDFVVEATLRNGTPVTLRAARPDDQARIAQAFAHLDRESVYTRFFVYKSELSAADFARIGSVDLVRHALLLATLRQGDEEVVIAGASYVAHDEADGTLSAEIAFMVEEDYQGQGLARRLLEQLVRIARDAGIARFVAEVLPGNKAMLSVFSRTGLPVTQRREDGVVHVTLDLSSGR